MIALHARRSARVDRGLARAAARRALVVVLTGTDLYRDIADDADALASLHMRRPAGRAARTRRRSALPAALRAKARVMLAVAARRGRRWPRPRGTCAR